MTPSGTPVARLQVRLDGCLPALLYSSFRAAVLEHLYIFFSHYLVQYGMAKELYNSY